MDRLFCALFDDEPSAASAIDELVNGVVGEEVVSVVMHEGTVTHEDLGVAAGKSGRGMLQGGAIGTTIGAVLGGLIAGPAGVLAGGPLASALVGGATGGLYGMLAGAISGRDGEQQALEDVKQALEAGKILVTLEIHGPKEARTQAAKILSRFGGRHITIT
jgi:hypothetical protein